MKFPSRGYRLPSCPPLFFSFERSLYRRYTGLLVQIFFVLFHRRFFPFFFFNKNARVVFLFEEKRCELI